MKKVGIILPPEFRRLPAMHGGLYRWFEASQAGFLPKPHAIIGVSAGSIVGAADLPWTEESFSRHSYLIKNLTTQQIFTLPWDVETEKLLLAAPYLLFFLDFKNWSKKKRLLLHGAELAFSIALSKFLFRQFLKRSSVFSNKPLYQLLKNHPNSKLDFNAIFSSDIKLEVLATDMESEKEVVFCNHSLIDQNPERFTKAILASSRLPGWFPPILLNGRALIDGGVLGYAPLHRAVKAGCDVIVVFLFTPLSESGSLPGNFMEDMVEASHITSMLVTRLTIDAYMAELSRGARLPVLHIVKANRPLAELTFKNFTSEALVDSMNLGYEAVDKDIPLLQNLVA